MDQSSAQSMGIKFVKDPMEKFFAQSMGIRSNVVQMARWLLTSLMIQFLQAPMVKFSALLVKNQFAKV